MFDPTLFRNGGYSYWEIEESKKAKPAAAIAPVAPVPQIELHKQPSCVQLTVQAVFAAAESSPTPAPPVAAPLGASISPASETTNTKELPSLTAQDIGLTKGPSPTDAALEKSVETTTTDTDKLAVALQEIERLKTQLAEAVGPQVTGLRKRGGAVAQAGAETAVEKTKEVVNAAQGVPVEVVGGLLVAVFVLTYLFF